MAAVYSQSISLRHDLFSSLHDRTESFISAFSHSVDELTVGFAHLKEDITDTLEAVGLHMRTMSARASAHLKMGLMGMKKMIENGFIDGWRMLEQRSLGRLSSELFETIVQFDRIIQQLQYTSSTENVMRKILYFSMDSQLSYKMDLTIQAMDNFTKVYHGFLNAEPLSSHLVTPSRRYDDVLIPFDMLSKNTAKQQEFYNGISQLLAGYIEQILQLQNILKEVYHMSTLNETAYSTAKNFFYDQSQAFNFYFTMFRDKIVFKSTDTIEHQVVSFKKANHSLASAYTGCEKAMSAIVDLIDTDIQKVQGEVVTFAQAAQDYVIDKQKWSISDLAEIGLSEDLQISMVRSQEINWQLSLYARKLNESWDQLQSATQRVWREMLGESTLRNYYVRLHNDVTDMVQNPMKSRFYTGIFLHPKMLAMTEQEVAGLQPHHYFTLLNADSALYRPEQKAAGVTEEVGASKVHQSAQTILQSSVGKLQVTYHNLRNNLREFTRSSQMDDTFARCGICI